MNFYPRPPRGGRHRALDSMMDKWDISIHALREEGDSCRRKSLFEGSDFYPRPPRGGRRGADRLHCEA